MDRFHPLNWIQHSHSPHCYLSKIYFWSGQSSAWNPPMLPHLQLKKEQINAPQILQEDIWYSVLFPSCWTWQPTPLSLLMKPSCLLVFSHATPPWFSFYLLGCIFLDSLELSALPRPLNNVPLSSILTSLGDSTPSHIALCSKNSQTFISMSTIPLICRLIYYIVPLCPWMFHGYLKPKVFKTISPSPNMRICQLSPSL